MRKKMVLEKLVHSPFSQMTRLLARENFTEFCTRDRFKLYDTTDGLQVQYISFS